MSTTADEVVLEIKPKSESKKDSPLVTHKSLFLKGGRRMSRNIVKLVALLLIGLLVGGSTAYALIPGPPPGAFKPLVAPGEKDEYYAFFSGGTGGDIRVFGVPSMRLIRVIPVFNPSGQFSYARETDGNRELLDNSGGARWGNTLYPVLSKTNGDYDGKLMFTQDEANARIAKIDLKIFETEKISKLPNMKTARALAVDPNSKYLMVAGQSDSQNGKGVISFVDPETLKVGFQVVGSEIVMLDGGKNGNQVFGVVPQVGGQQGGIAVFNLKAIEAAIASNEYQKINNVPVLDAGQVKEVIREGPCPPWQNLQRQ